ncbi:PilZ domain-containing protein [Gimesia sp.]|uniref:PilZ domain-containing protein n=1 Tax=Gimesia sp. TaxID=2024833 RepID=UPI0032EBCDAE
MTTRVATTSTGRTWGSLLQKLEQRKSPVAPEAGHFEHSQGHPGERRAFPRHASDAIILAFNQDEPGLTSAGEATGKKGYAINVSRNGISFAARSEFQPREQLQLCVEETQLNFTLNVSAEVLRCESLDSEFRRVDCKLVTPLTDQQIQLLKEHVPSCFAG